MYLQRGEFNHDSQEKVRHPLIALQQLPLKTEPNIDL